MQKEKSSSGDSKLKTLTLGGQRPQRRCSKQVAKKVLQNIQLQGWHIEPLTSSIGAPRFTPRTFQGSLKYDEENPRIRSLGVDNFL